METIQDTTFLNPIAIAIIFLGACSILFLSKRYAIASLILLGFFVPMSQRIVVFSLDFYILRILIILLFLRLTLRRQIFVEELNSIDKFIILWTISSFITYCILLSSTDGFIRASGRAFNSLGLYFGFRLLITDADDIKTTLNILSLTAILIAVFMSIEYFTSRNIFYIFGGVPEITEIRDGHLRCQGPFGHPISTGIFGATTFPLCFYLYRQGNWVGKVGCIAATLAVIFSASSTPFLAYFASVVALCMWPLRQCMRFFRWSCFATLILLNIVMNGPVWALITRVKVFGSSSGYHRFELVNQFIHRFNEWFLYGTQSTAHWGWLMNDVANQFVRQGVDGGILTFLLFVFIIVYCFKQIGIAVQQSIGSSICLFFWCLGSSLFSHVSGFFGFSYWDQIWISWFLLLSIISTSTKLIKELEIDNSLSPANSLYHHL